MDFTATNGDKLTVYTTRCDTLFGVTYMVISPEHPYLAQWKDQLTNWDAVEAYRQEAARKSDFERGELNKEKTGVRLEGIEAVHPVTGKHIPIFVSDYVLMGYGTGIVMGVPGHDQRDWDFATAFGLPIVEVVKGGDVTKCGLRPEGRHRHHGQLRLPQRPHRQGGHPHHEEVGHGAGHRPSQDQLQAP